MAHLLEFDEVRHGLRCVVLKMNEPPSFLHRCGYVGVPKSHPLYGKKYIDTIPNQIPKDAQIGKRGVIPLFLHAVQDGEGTSLDIFFDVHGSITYSENCGDYPIPHFSDLWWFGFDTNHSQDQDDPKSLDYCINECDSLAKQLAEFKMADAPVA